MISEILIIVQKQKNVLDFTPLLKKQKDSKEKKIIAKIASASKTSLRLLMPKKYKG